LQGEGRLFLEMRSDNTLRYFQDSRRICSIVT
jgi:hypothetical protein